MADTEIANAGIAVALMAILLSIMLYLRLTGTPFFDLLFEICLFYLPIGILIGYIIFLKSKAHRA